MAIRSVIVLLQKLQPVVVQHVPGLSGQFVHAISIHLLVQHRLKWIVCLQIGISGHFAQNLATKASNTGIEKYRSMPATMVSHAWGPSSRHRPAMCNAAKRAIKLIANGESGANGRLAPSLAKVTPEQPWARK